MTKIYEAMYQFYKTMKHPAAKSYFMRLKERDEFIRRQTGSWSAEQVVVLAGLRNEYGGMKELESRTTGDSK